MAKSNLIIPTDCGVSRVFLPLVDSVLEYPDKITKNDIVLFEGGTDVNPSLYGDPKGSRTGFSDHQRDAKEWKFFNLAQEAGAFCLGICRGAQFLTALSGGKLFQDVTGHTSDHAILTDEGKEFYVTSTHHQMCNPFNLPDGYFELIAWSIPRRSKYYLKGEDKEVEEPPVEPEIIWYPKTRSLAIQGHPEYLVDNATYPVFCRNLVDKLF